jgi:hypothetical protein
MVCIKNAWSWSASLLAAAVAVLLLPGACGGSDVAAGDKAKNDSIKRANAKQDSIRKAAYKNHDLSIIFLEASSQLLQCQLLLEKADAGGQKYGMADSLLVNSKKGDTLYQTITKLYDLGTLYANNETDKKRFAGMKTPADSKQWLEKYFKGVQSVEALNTLSRLQRDCNTINGMVPR